MTALLFTKTLLATLAMTIQATSNWNQETRDYVLEIHNDYRRGERGCLMNKLVYDMELERQARKWAEGCLYGHERKQGRGENLAFDTNQIPEKELILGSSRDWFNEKNHYSYGQLKCGSSCHYSQMVWGSTSKLGCYTYRCPILVGASENAWYFVCFYTPKGNIQGVKPYVDQKSCTRKCSEGQTEDKGLCVGEAKGGSVNQGGEKKGGSVNQGGEKKGGSVNQGGEKKGGSVNQGGEKKGGSVIQGGEEGGCKDDDARCAEWAERGECDINPGYMLQSCKKSCDVCGNKTSCKDCADKTKGGSVSKVGDDKGCNDDMSECVDWAERGECKAKQDYVEKSCRKSCKVCCVDSISRCSKWAKENECKTNPDWMRSNCRHSCKQCNSGNRCVDLKSNCYQRAKANECDSNPSYMSTNCQKSCEMC